MEKISTNAKAMGLQCFPKPIKNKGLQCLIKQVKQS